MKKLLAITLTLVMILGSIAISAFAEPTWVSYSFDGSFSEDGNFAYNILDDGTICVVAYCGDEKEVVIPETIDGYTVSEIFKGFGTGDDTGALSDFELDKLTIPSTINDLYLINTVVKEIVVSEGVTSIHLHFVEVEKINIPEGVTYLFLRWCDGLKELELPKSLKSISHAGLPFSCPDLEKVTVTPSTTYIEDKMFYTSTTFYGYENSYIEYYAAKNSHNFESIGVFGDVNQDGNFNGKDVLELRKSIVGLESSIDEYNSDINFDGRINGKDVLAIRKQLVGLTSYLGEDTEPDDTTPVETPSDIVVETPDNL